MKKNQEPQPFRVRGSLKTDTNKVISDMVMAVNSDEAGKQFSLAYPDYNVINVMSLDEMEASAARLREFRDKMKKK